MRRLTKSAFSNEHGFWLLEIIMASAIFGIAVIGFTLLLSRGQEIVVDQGDTRVATSLAQQKLERLTAHYCNPLCGGGFSNVPIGNMTATDCPGGDFCYSETLSPASATGLGLGMQVPGTDSLDQQTFTRKTCVRVVQDDDPTQPTDTRDPATWTCTPCSPISPGTVCSGYTKRVTVAVYPTTSETSRLQGAMVTLETVLTNPNHCPSGVAGCP